MTESEWLSSEDPAAMLHVMASGIDSAGTRIGSDRKLRLLIAAGMRIVLPESKLIPQVELMADDRSIPPDGRWWPTDADPLDGARCVITASRNEKSLIRLACVLRDIIGNPWCPVALAPEEPGDAFKALDILFRESRREPKASYLPRSVLTWNAGIVTLLAESVYDERNPDGTLEPVRLAILADALEEAGCDNAELLAHLRGLEHRHAVLSGGLVSREPCVWSPLRGPHVRGCWALDLILGKE